MPDQGLLSYGDLKVPGSYITEGTLGVTSANLADHSTVYFIGRSTVSAAPKNICYYIESADDFYNVFGDTLSSPSVQLYFEQQPGLGFWFVNVDMRTERTLTIPTATVGDVFTLTIDGFPLTYTAVTGDNPAKVLIALAGLVNSKMNHVASMYGNKLRYANGKTVTATANITLGTANTASYPTPLDVIDSVNLAFVDNLPPGFVIAPEFYQAFTMVDRQALANGLEGIVSDSKRYWMHLMDCGSEVALSTGSGGAINLALLDISGVSTPRGHVAYYFPYWLNLTAQPVPMSASVAAIAIKRYRNESFIQPPAGEDYPVRGVTGQTFLVSYNAQAALNPANVNCGRMLTQQRSGGLKQIGVPVIYGARTLATDLNYRYVTTRVIMNVLENSLRLTLRNVPFRTIDGVGIQMQRITGLITNVCELMRQVGALWSATGTAEGAYLVICNGTNNSPDMLDQGKPLAQVYVRPAPLIEFLQTIVYRVPLGFDLSTIASEGGSSNNGQPKTATPPTGTPGTKSTSGTK
jgi:hypothetical protein